MSKTVEKCGNPGHILAELGIREPEDLDVEAIAQHCGATIRYATLRGCAARIMGFRDRAIITVDPTVNRGRQRFSAGHELGHWMRDRGEVAFQCDENKLRRGWLGENPEGRANRFASDLLMPIGMFKPRSRNLPVTFDTVRSLANLFQMSITATAIRLVEHGGLPSMLVSNNATEREWSFASDGVRGRLGPKERPGSGSIAYELLRGNSSAESPRDVGADDWVTHRNAQRYWVHEDSLLIRDDVVLTLLWWRDESQLIDIDEAEESLSSRRSDWKDD